jgi:hypothetical protein
MEIQWVVHRQVVGFKRVKVGEAGAEVEAWDPGEMLATRNNGDEILFAPTPVLPDEVIPHDVPKEPAVWIPLSDFSINPFCLAYAEDFGDDELDEHPARPTAKGPMPMAPGGAKRRGK